MTNKIHYASSWQLPPTDRQVAAITRLCLQLGIKEPLEETPSNRWEAKRLLWDLMQERSRRNAT